MNGTRIKFINGPNEGRRGIIIGQKPRRAHETVTYTISLDSGIVHSTDKHFEVLDNRETRRSKPRPYGVK